MMGKAVHSSNRDLAMSTQTVKRLKHPVREYKLDRDGRHDIAQAESLRDQYEDYINTTSLDYMAASLESSALLCSLADITGAGTVVDLGSGFSSYVLRDYAAQTTPTPVVYSVDDSGEWLGKTREYLERLDSTTEHLYDWREFESKDHLKFDLIFHDMGNMELRASALPWVIDHLNPGGFALLDDMHKARYRKKAEAIIAETDLQLFSMRELTLDKLGRFAMLLHRPA